MSDEEAKGEESRHFVHEILDSYLFALPTMNKAGTRRSASKSKKMVQPPKCKHNKTRKAAFDFLLAFVDAKDTDKLEESVVENVAESINQILLFCIPHHTIKLSKTGE